MKFFFGIVFSAFCLGFDLEVLNFVTNVYLNSTKDFWFCNSNILFRLFVSLGSISAAIIEKRLVFHSFFYQFFFNE